MERIICGIDIGGSGCRIAIAYVQTIGESSIIRQQTTMRLNQSVTANSQGSTASEVISAAFRLLRNTHPDIIGNIHAVGIGCAGFSSFITDKEKLCRQTASLFQCPNVIIAADALTAHAGALQGKPGIIIAAGTGVIALATDYSTFCRRTDGWGYLLGDTGGGSWIGRHALHIALDTYEYRGQTHSASLLQAATAAFGTPAEWPSRIYPYNDRAKILASFVPAVLACAATDPVALELLRSAGRELSYTLQSALANNIGMPVSYTGSILTKCDPVRASFLDNMHKWNATIDIASPAGTPLDGAVQLAMHIGLISSQAIGSDIYVSLHGIR